MAIVCKMQQILYTSYVYLYVYICKYFYCWAKLNDLRAENVFDIHIIVPVLFPGSAQLSTSFGWNTIDIDFDFIISCVPECEKNCTEECSHYCQ